MLLLAHEGLHLGTLDSLVLLIELGFDEFGGLGLVFYLDHVVVECQVFIYGHEHFLCGALQDWLSI